MSITKKTFQDAFLIAVKERNTLSTGVLRLIISEIKKKEIEKKQAELTLDEIYKVLRGMLKQRQESMEAFKKGAREDLYEQEKNEASVIESFLPKAPSVETLSQLVKEAIEKTQSSSMKDMKKILEYVTSHAGSGLDGKIISDLVKKQFQTS